MTKLIPALRQFRHNNSDEFVTGYDELETRKLFYELETQLSEANAAISNINKWVQGECNYDLLESSIVDDYPDSVEAIGRALGE